jgi:hypothetical protein
MNNNYILGPFPDVPVKKDKLTLKAFNYQTFPDKHWQYAVFTNPAIAPIDGSAVKFMGDSDYVGRWLSFYEPDEALLPHATYVTELFNHKTYLEQTIRSLLAPRFAALSLVVVSIIILMARGHILATLIPTIISTWYWYHTQPAIKLTQDSLNQHIEHMLAVREHYQRLQTALVELPMSVSPAVLSTHLERATQSLLQKTLLHLNSTTQSTANQHEYRVFGQQTWAYTQLGFSRNALSKTLVSPEKQALAALLMLSGKQANIARLTCINLWILTPNGLLMGQGFYDVVTLKFIDMQIELLSYQNIQQCQQKEQILPEMNELKGFIKETVYQRYFMQALPVLSIKTREGKRLNYAGLLSTEYQPLTTFYKSDLKQLVRLLNERTLGMETKRTIAVA